MPDATFTRPDLTTFCQLDEQGLKVLRQRLDLDRAMLASQVAGPDKWCRRCGCEGAPRDMVTRRLAHEPLGRRATTVLFTLRRYRYTGTGMLWRRNTTKATEARAKLSRRALTWAPDGLAVQYGQPGG